jgi:2-C-methyl-D-erythritol 4-phosphate cytidylyltransferase
MEVALIVAGGRGNRMQSDTPKQFIEIAGLPVLMHTIKVFASYSPDIRILVVLPENQMAVWQSLITKFKFTIQHNVVAGGETRFQSVKNGLEYVDDADLVAVHDGVRPLVSKNIISASYQMASRNGSAVAAIPLKDSIREIMDSGVNAAVNRNRFRIIQTPQTFKASLIKKGYETEELPVFTDDASVVEKSGHKIYLIEGDPKNINITTPEDLAFARLILENADTQA